MARAVPAVGRAFDVLELFLAEAELSAPEITAALGLPRTTVHELLGTLVERGYLVAAGEGGTRFRLGVRTFQLGSAYAERLDLAREGRLAAQEAALRCGETVHVAVLDGTEVLYVAKVDSTHPVRMVSAVGRRLPAHCTAVGKVLLAALPKRRFAELYAGRRLVALTARSTTSRRELRRELDVVAATGIAREHCESNEAVACVAAPVRDSSGAVVAAMSASVPTPRWDDAADRALTGIIREGAAELSRRLGHAG
ncbi:IclR family transcriptional regulator [Saccharopolyspora gregorii]|uniref:IclR family transcriptional regulator n=1 Tax=Saccharopolyspora gregorii TaxID=33914 RepID=UPI0021AC8FDC|nr:IclR family transcriptional regulator [Saccharopolyspora gregorii]